MSHDSDSESSENRQKSCDLSLRLTHFSSTLFITLLLQVGKVEFITSFGGESDSGAKSSGNEGDNDGKKKKRVRELMAR